MSEQYANQRAHDVAWMTAAERERLEAEQATRDLAGPGAACWEYQAGEMPIRLSFSIKVF
jgi:hypothetical protein